MSVPKSRRIHNESYTDHLRYEFLRHLTQDPVFDRVTSELKSLWSLVLDGSDAPDDIGQLPYFALIETDSTLMAVYKFALERAVTGQLRCRQDGKAPDWICEAVHGFVTDSDVDVWIRMRRDPRMHSGALHIRFPLGGPPSIAKEIDGGEGGRPIRIGPMADEFLLSGVTLFTDWEEVRRVAHAALDDLVSSLSTVVMAETEDWREVRRGGHETRIEQTMPVVVARLTRGAPLHGGDDRKNFGKLLEDLSLDNPGRLSPSAKKHRPR